MNHQNSAIPQQTQFYTTTSQQQAAIIYQAQAAERFQQMSIHPNQHPINVQPINAHGIVGNGQHPHQQLHNYATQGPAPHTHTQPLMNIAPNNQPIFAHPNPHQQPPIALLNFNVKAPPPMPHPHQQPQHFYPQQQHQQNLPPPQSAPPYHGQNQQPSYNPYMEAPPPLAPYQQHQQTHYYQQPQQQHQQNLPPQSAPPYHGHQNQIFLQYPITLEPPPPLAPHQQLQQNFYPSQHQQQNLTAQSAPPNHSHNQPSSYILPTKDRRSFSIQPADASHQAIGNGNEGGNNIVAGNGSTNATEGTDNGNERDRDGQTPEDGRESSTVDGRQRKTTLSSMEAKEEDMKRSTSGNGDINNPMNRMGEWQAPPKDKPIATICPNNIGGSGGDGHSTPSDLATNSTAINATSNYQNRQPNSQPQSCRESQDVRNICHNSFLQQQSGRGEQQNWKNQNRQSNNSYNKSNIGIGGGSNGPTTNMYNYNLSNVPHQFHHQYNQKSFGGGNRQSQDVRSQQCMCCGSTEHRLQNCQKSKYLASFAQQFEKQTHHPALQLPKEMIPPNRVHHYQQQHSSQGGRSDYYHHNTQSQQYNQHKRVGSGGGGGNRYNNYGGRDSGGSSRGQKRVTEGNNNYRSQPQ